MKRNPCKTCDSAYVRKGNHYPSYRTECDSCERYKRHKEYLVAHRKFEVGEKITSFEELLGQEHVFWREVPRHIEVIKSLPLRIVIDALNNGCFYKAIRKGEKTNET